MTSHELARITRKCRRDLIQAKISMTKARGAVSEAKNALTLAHVNQIASVENAAKARADLNQIIAKDLINLIENEETPIEDCVYQNDEDGCCSHGNNMTAECNISACPRLDKRIDSILVKAALLRYISEEAEKK